MKVTFAPELPAGDDWEALRVDVQKALSYFKEGYVEFPSELLVRLNTTPFHANGVAVSLDGTPIMEISYNLLDPHRADYRYVGPSKSIELPEEPDA